MGHDAIERNKREGLLCACNRRKVPYGPPPGVTLQVTTTEHGYEHCEDTGASEAIKAFLRYSWEPIEYRYDKLTGDERALCDRDTFEMLAAWVQS